MIVLLIQRSKWSRRYGYPHDLEQPWHYAGIGKVLKLDKLTVTTGSLDYQDEKADVGDDYYNIEMGKYIMNNFMVTAAFGLNHDDNRFGFEYTPNRFGIAAWKSNDDSFIGGVYRFNFH